MIVNKPSEIRKTIFAVISVVWCACCPEPAAVAKSLSPQSHMD